MSLFQAPASAQPRRAAARRDEPLQALTWALWLGCAVGMIMLTSNPLYITTIGLCGFVIYLVHRQRAHRPMDYLLLAGVGVAIITIPLNLVSGSSGYTAIAELPTLRLPGWLGSVRFGGTVTAESLVYAADRAASVAAIFAVAWGFNVSVDHFRLLRHVPAALVQLGIVTTIAVLLVPQTLAQAAALREARTARGYGRARLAGAVAMALPLLSGALEQSVQRAESLDARGFGRLASERTGRELAVATAALMLAAYGAFAFYSGAHKALALTALLGGAALVVAVLWQLGRRSTAAPLKQAALSAADRAVILASIAAITMFCAARATGTGALAYVPFPRLEAPAFSPVPVVACLLLILPALFERPAVAT